VRGHEWIGGIVSLPLSVTGEGRRYRPQSILWLEVNGPIRGHRTTRPGEALACAGESLQEAIERPLAGAPGAPARVRVASPELAEALRRSHPTLDVVLAPTPELDDLMAELRARAAEDAPPPSYLSSGAAPAQLASFFAAAAALFRARPWAEMVEEESVLSVHVPALGVHGQVLSLIGDQGDGAGLVLFRDFSGYAMFVDAVEAIEDGEDAEWPPHLRLDFEPADATDPALCAEVATHGWELASREAYPWPVRADDDGVIWTASPDDVAVLEATARALTIAIAEAPAIIAAAHGDEPWTRVLRVATHAGELEVTLRAPPGDEDDEDSDGTDEDAYRAAAEDDAGDQAQHDGDLLGELARLVDEADAGPIDHERRVPLEDRLDEQFRATTEGAATSDLQGHRLFMDQLTDACGVTIANATAGDVHEALFDAIPRKVSVDASAAAAIVDDLRAFYRFLDRAHGLPQAAACLRVLDGGAVRRLETNLGDRRRFGPAKALVMAGREAGYDMDTREGVEASMREVSTRPVPASVWSPPAVAAPPPRGPTPADRKKQRKAARAARKRNR
jgi:hypothetical protein